MSDKRSPRVVAFNHDAEFLALLGAALRGAGYEATTTRHVGEVLALIADQPPATVVLDVAPGGAAAWDLLARLRADPAARGIPVLVTATVDAHLDRARADPAAYAGDAFLAKPFGLDDLLGAVRRLAGPA